MVLYLSRPIILCSEPMLILIFALQLCDSPCNYFSTFQFLCTLELKEDLSYYAVPFTHCSSVCYWPSTASIAMQWWKPQTARSIWCPPTCHPSLCCLSLLLSSSCHMFPKTLPFLYTKVAPLSVCSAGPTSSHSVQTLRASKTVLLFDTSFHKLPYLVINCQYLSNWTIDAIHC